MFNNYPTLQNRNSLFERSFFPSYEPVVIETPETILARETPSSTFNLIREFNKQKHQEKVLEIGANITQTYLNRLESHHVNEINKIEIQPIEEGFSFLTFKKKSKGLEIIFHR